jgi:carbon monoxide dehydrogenase subunit G
MVIEGSYTFAAPVEQVLAALGDPDMLCAALPGCERLIQLGPPRPDGAADYEARVRLRDAVYTAALTVKPEPDVTQLHVRLDGRGPDGPFRGKGTLALTGAATSDATPQAQTVGAYVCEVEAPGLSPIQEGAFANGAGQLFAATLCDQLMEVLSAPRIGNVGGAGGRFSFGNGDLSSEGAREDAAERLLGMRRMSGLVRTQTPYGQIVALPSTPPAPFSHLWMQYALGMLTGFAAGLGAIVLLVALLRRMTPRSAPRRGSARS